MPSRRTFLQGLLLSALSVGAGLPARAAPVVATTPLRLAVHPYAGALTLANTHRPLVAYLEKSLQRPVEFYTAANFDAYVASLMAGEYDIAIAPPHFGVMAMEKGYVPLVNYQRQLEPVVVVRAASTIRGLEALQGKRIAMADKSAFIRLVIVKWLADNDLVAGKDYQIVERPNHAASATAVLAGEADAALSTTTAVRQMAPELREQMHLLNPHLPFPHLFTLANRRLGADTIARLRAALKTFPTDSAEGREFFEKSGFIGYDEITDDDVRRIKPYVDTYRRMIAPPGS